MHSVGDMRRWRGTVFEANVLMKSKKEIFKDILISAQTNCVLKIQLVNEDKPFITAVDHISKNKIVLKPTCLYGYKLKKRSITLLEIDTVQRYQTHFDHPLFERMRYVKSNISAIRKRFESLREEPSGALQ